MTIAVGQSWPRGDARRAYLLVLELDKSIVILDDLVAEVLGLGE